MSDLIWSDTFVADAEAPPFDYEQASETTLAWRASVGDAEAADELQRRKREREA
jgi:hypothetical protein